MPLVLLIGSDRHVIEEGKSVAVGPLTFEIKDARVMVRAVKGVASVGEVALREGRVRHVRPGDRIEIDGKDAKLESTETSPALDTRQMALAIVKEIHRAGAGVHPVVSVVEGDDLGAQLELELEGRSYRVGRSSSCELPLADANVSREHFTLSRKGGRVFVRDLASARGVFLGKSRLQPNRDAAWDPSLMLRAGDTVLGLTVPAGAILDAAVEKIPIIEEPAVAAPLPSPAPPSKPLDAPAAGAAPIAAAPISGALPAKAPTKFQVQPVLIAVGVVVIAMCVGGIVWLFK